MIAQLIAPTTVGGKFGHQVFIWISTITHGDTNLQTNLASDSIQQVPKRGECFSGVYRRIAEFRISRVPFSTAFIFGRIYTRRLFLGEYKNLFLGEYIHGVYF